MMNLRNCFDKHDFVVVYDKIKFDEFPNIKSRVTVKTCQECGCVSIVKQGSNDMQKLTEEQYIKNFCITYGVCESKFRDIFRVERCDCVLCSSGGGSGWSVVALCLDKEEGEKK